MIQNKTSFKIIPKNDEHGNLSLAIPENSIENHIPFLTGNLLGTRSPGRYTENLENNTENRNNTGLEKSRASSRARSARTCTRKINLINAVKAHTLAKQDQSEATKNDGILSPSTSSGDKMPFVPVDLDQRIKTVSKRKRRNNAMANYLHSRDTKLTSKIRSCASHIVYRKYLETQETKLIKGYFCDQVKLCPVCASIRMVKTSSKYYEKYLQLHETYPDDMLYFITFTMKNSDDLEERVKTLKSSFSTLIKKSCNARNGSRHKTEFGKIRGGVYSVEIKRGRNSKKWHPHIHAIVSVKDVLDIESLKREWLNYTSDSNVIQIVKVDTEDKEFSAFLEVFNYSLKFSTMNLSDNYKAYHVTKNMRLVSSWGCFRGVKVPEKMTDDFSDTDKMFIDFIFKYNFKDGEYRLSEIEIPEGLEASTGLEIIPEGLEASTGLEIIPEGLESVFHKCSAGDPRGDP